jgi:hypothetical protein
MPPVEVDIVYSRKSELISPCTSINNKLPDIITPNINNNFSDITTRFSFGLERQQSSKPGRSPKISTNTGCEFPKTSTTGQEVPENSTKAGSEFPETSTTGQEVPENSTKAGCEFPKTSETGQEVPENSTKAGREFPKTSLSSVPTFVPFSEVVSIYEILNTLRGKGQFSLGAVKRALKRTMAAASNRSVVPDRPHAFDVVGMYDPIMFKGGLHPLPPGDSPLKVPVMDSYHIASCPKCSDSVDPLCYWHGLREPLANGWLPPIKVSSIQPLYDATGLDGNHKSASIFPATIQKELAAQVELGICTPFHSPVLEGLIAPLGASLRTSDKTKAFALTGIKIVDQASLDKANSILLDKGIPKIKVRPIHDATSVGINEASYVAHFSNSGIDDAIPLISQNCYMGKLDVSRFFHNFPLAPEIRYLFWVFFAFVFYQMNRVIFGLGTAPYFTSAYGAEIRRWILHERIPAVHYCDDHFTAGKTYALVMAYLKAITFIFVAIGFSIAMDKFEIAQRLVHLSVLFDSVKMSMSFDPLSASSFHTELSLSLSKVIAGDHLTHGEIRHIAGKLSHYSQVCQSGRCHIRWWWIYLHYGSQLSTYGVQQLQTDSLWWLDLLHVWAQSEFSGIEYPIFSSSSLMDNNMVIVLQSDASGPHGFGYIFGFIDELDPLYHSERWSHREEILCDSSSQFAELRALSHFVTNTDDSNKILLWVSDSQAAVYSVNNGSCHAATSMDLISSILSLCDAKHIYIIALWIPREQNLLPDYLSHFAYYINSEVAAGRVSDLPAGGSG